MNKNKTRPLFCDNNAFRRLSTKNRYDTFMEKLSTVEDIQTTELLSAIQNNTQVQEPLMFLEYFGIPQKVINQRLEVQLKSTFIRYKDILKPFITEFEKNNQKDIESFIKLSPGFCEVVDEMYEDYYEILENYEEFSLENLYAKLKAQEDIIKDPSVLFTNYCGYWKENLKNLQPILLAHFTIETIFRFSSNMITQNYPGNKSLKIKWCDYIGNFCLVLRNNKQNISGYRNINETLEIINQNLKPQFLPAFKLGLYDDTLDSYFTHFLTFGWFNEDRQLISILGLTFDKYERVLERIKQYQSYLAYEQNPSRTHSYELRDVLYKPNPGTAFVINQAVTEINELTIDSANSNIKSDGSIIIEFNLKEKRHLLSPKSCN